MIGILIAQVSIGYLFRQPAFGQTGGSNSVRKPEPRIMLL